MIEKGLNFINLLLFKQIFKLKMPFRKTFEDINFYFLYDYIIGQRCFKTHNFFKSLIISIIQYVKILIGHKWLFIIIICSNFCFQFFVEFLLNSFFLDV